MMALLKIGDFVDVVERPALSAPIPQLWYMLRVVPNREIAIERRLSARGVSVYLPTERVTRRIAGRRVLQPAAIFAGAMFIPDFEADLRRLRGMVDGLIGYVRFESTTVVIRPKMMEAIRKFETFCDLPPSERKRAFEVGQQVRIKGTSLDMWMGRIARLDSRNRLTVLVRMLGQMVPVELSEDQIEAV